MSIGWGGRKPFSMSWLRLPKCFTQIWQTTATNAWGYEMEQKTTDGRYRNRTFDDNLNPTPWVDGPHPIAQKLRDEGKEETEHFKRIRR